MIECMKTVVQERKLIDDSFFGTAATSLLSGDDPEDGPWRRESA